MLAMSSEYKLNPESLEFTDTYLTTLDIVETCKILEISEEQGNEILNKKEVKRFIDSAFLNQGYTNRFKIKDVMEKAIQSKLDEAEETGIYTKYDLLDLMKFMQQMRLDESKIQNTSPNTVQNIQNNFGGNLGNLLSKIAK